MNKWDEALLQEILQQSKSQGCIVVVCKNRNNTELLYKATKVLLAEEGQSYTDSTVKHKSRSPKNCIEINGCSIWFVSARNVHFSWNRLQYRGFNENIAHYIIHPEALFAKYSKVLEHMTRFAFLDIRKNTQ